MLEVKSGSEQHPLMKQIDETEQWERVSRVETIGEMLVRLHAIKLSELVTLIEEWEEDQNVPLGELAVERGLISKESLSRFLDTQAKCSKVIDESLEEMGHMTNEEKWHKLLLHDKSLGDILLKKKKLKLDQLTSAIEEQKNNPEKTLERILLENSIVTQAEIQEALEYYKNLEEVTLSTVKQIKNFSS